MTHRLVSGAELRRQSRHRALLARGLAEHGGAARPGALDGESRLLNRWQHDDKGARSEIPVIPVKLNGPNKPQPGAVAIYDTTLMLRNIQQQLALVLYDVAGEKMLSTSLDFDPGSG